MNSNNYFDKYIIDESLIMQYLYCEQDQKVKIVFDLADRVLSKSINEYFSSKKEREMHMLIFNYVSGYKRKKVGKIFRKTNLFNSAVDKPSFCVYGVENEQFRDLQQFRACFGIFGEVEFKYKALSFEIKIIEAKKDAKNEIIYIDSHTGNTVDFHNIFEIDLLNGHAPD